MTLTEPKHLKLWKRAENYAGTTWPDYYVVLGQHRDSDRITRSNFAVAKKQLEAIEDKYPEWNKADDEGRMLVNPYEGHWAVGHIEWIGVHKDAPQELIDAADDILDRIESYPILNESHWSDLEYTEAMEFWDSLSLSSKVDFCRDCKVSIFAARRNHDLPDRLWERLTND